MKIIHRDLFLILVSAVILHSNFGHGHEATNPEKYVTRSLSISGKVKKKLELSVADIKKMPSQVLTNVPIISKKGTEVIKSYKGVLLKDILNHAEINAEKPGDTKRMFIVASASDHYKAIFSWNELFNSPVSDGILVVYEKNENELKDSEGKILLVSTKDFMTGFRHVRWLKSIEVRKLED